MDQALINRIVEAALLAANQPLTLAQLHALFSEEQPAPPGGVETALERLGQDCAERGVELVEVASGFRYQVKADVHSWVARLWTERRTKYTRATLETLALIAYRQPITRGEIEQVRGVAVSSNIVQALEEREWIRVVGHRDVPGKPALYGTTKVFLDYFGLKRLDELPPLSELKDFGELDPQLPLDPDTAPMQAGVAAQDSTPAGDDGAAPDDSGHGPVDGATQDATATDAPEAGDAAGDDVGHAQPEGGADGGDGTPATAAAAEPADALRADSDSDDQASSGSDQAATPLPPEADDASGTHTPQAANDTGGRSRTHD
ncbi:SMC-Scp complex subunit ScpB [Pseudoxanthomonas broegbernensis]|uniref:SMC-Scp complex subunit ScpB n=1 Tax=Pseudoxanthomonas broegbernensis TaxID=83619 RepID=A0A7V8K8D1_9GAMM|nr:SMC-Scp complex subunit ScpB [Pseudoxanthomonas broegbernensis]KAF1687586.1 SMC-Scp complex subunit ScpB [Pseudoxanthomonas broegbernensis]MBB6064602.1 segregation and condensation protein B [Pseudoxanthomonas broegbernensis]